MKRQEWRKAWKVDVAVSEGGEKDTEGSGSERRGRGKRQRVMVMPL